MFPKIGTYFRIASFLNNQFGKRLKSDTKCSDDILERMRTRRNIENSLTIEVEEKGWLRKKVIFQNTLSDDRS